MLPALNKPTRVTRMTATAIDFMLTNSFIDSNFRTTIIKSDVSDHFPICFIIPSLKHQSKNETFYICKRIILPMSQLNCLYKGFLKLIGMKFKFIKTWMKPTKLFCINFLPYIIKVKTIFTKPLDN